MALDGYGDEWRTQDKNEEPVRHQVEDTTDQPTTLGHVAHYDEIIGGGKWREGHPEEVLNTTSYKSENHTGSEVWTVGGGKDGYENLGEARIAEDPVLRLFLRNDKK